jgi:hypothetical protein
MNTNTNTNTNTNSNVSNEHQVNDQSAHEHDSHQSNSSSGSCPGSPSRDSITSDGRRLSTNDLSSLSSTQKQCLESLKVEVLKHHPDHIATDYIYLRFLRARKFDTEAASTMYLNYVKWRHDAKIDDILIHPPLEQRALLERLVPESFHKFDKFGNKKQQTKIFNNTFNGVQDDEIIFIHSILSIHSILLFVFCLLFVRFTRYEYSIVIQLSIQHWLVSIVDLFFFNI